ncbi:MAG: xanthine phosphoribosyltransferase [Bacteroidaceae bacterium]|mgnify:CR=1 FL=1|nr:xanthine phosphoribosyltransferase [Bacteroidaceae bacterium]
MEKLMARISREGDIHSGGVLKVDSFINHQIDPALMYDCAAELLDRFKDRNFNKILTIESSGIVPAVLAGYIAGLPVVFAKKTKPISMGKAYSTTIHSFTRDNDYEVMISEEFLTADDRVLFIDDFLAYGNAALGMIDICRQAGASIEGMGFLIEKKFQNGRYAIGKSDASVKVESLAIIESHLGF